MRHPEMLVQPAQHTQGETLVIVDAANGAVLAESCPVWEQTPDGTVAAEYPASENVYGELYRMFAAAPAMLATLYAARDVIEHAPMPYTSPATLAEIDAVIALAEGRA